LRSNGISHNITLKQLRVHAGLDESTQHTSFDDATPFFIEAVNKIVKKYNLVIHVYKVDREGRILYFGNLYPDTIANSIRNNLNYDTLYKNKHIVDIANYGLDHFELIDTIRGENFQPAVCINNKITKIDVLKPELQNTYLDLYEKKGMLDIVYKQLVEDEKMLSKKIEEKDGTEKSKEYNSETEKKMFLSELNSEISNINNDINDKENFIKNLKDEIDSLELIIQLVD
jgi:hypothetical protein